MISTVIINLNSSHIMPSNENVTMIIVVQDCCTGKVIFAGEHKLLSLQSASLVLQIYFKHNF